MALMTNNQRQDRNRINSNFLLQVLLPQKNLRN